MAYPLKKKAYSLHDKAYSLQKEIRLTEDMVYSPHNVLRSVTIIEKCSGGRYFRANTPFFRADTPHILVNTPRFLANASFFVRIRHIPK